MTELPYRTFNEYLRKKFHKRVQKITLDAGLSCPNRDPLNKNGCIYCNTKGSGSGAFSQGISIKDQINEQLKIMKLRYKAEAFIAYFQSFSNTYASPDALKKIYDSILAFPEIIGLSIGTRPDCIDEKKLNLIKTYSDNRLVWMEYGLQSANDETLKRINRGHDVKAFIDAVNLTLRFNLRQCAHVIVGLPGEGMDDYVATARLISSLPITDIKIHLLYVIKDTPLHTMFERKEYTPLSFQDYIDAVSEFIAHLREDIIIQRITGDPHIDELVEPLWALEKTVVRNAIHQELDHTGITQGCKLR